MRKSIIVLLIPTIAILTGCSQEMSLHGADRNLTELSVTEAPKAIVYPDDNPSVPDGKPLFEQKNCAQCHGADGGKSVKASADGQSFNLALNDKLYMAKQKPLDQYMFLAYGKPGVHEALKDQLTRNQIWDLVFYARSLSVTPLTDDQVAQMKPVFGSNCAVCHGTRGNGDGPLARNMDPVPANFHQYNRFYDRTDNQIFDHIAYGIKWEGMPNFLDKKDGKKDIKFDEKYIRQLVQYVRSFGLSTATSATAQATKVDKVD